MAEPAPLGRRDRALSEIGLVINMRRHFPAYDAKRHLLAIERTLGWAEDAAAAGDVQEALAWLRLIEAVEGRLPHRLVPLRDDCEQQLLLVKTPLSVPTAA